MGFFDKFKSERDVAKEEIKEVPWHLITESEQLNEIEKESEKKTIAIFKHSTTCGISKMVLRNFESEFRTGKEEDNLKLYFLDLREYRGVSNEIAERFNVRHESPQLLVLKERKVVHHSSHHSIEAQKVKELA
ncbi:thioredoxin family protein [Salinimicrobium marinum]|uniref:Thioredoxin family protein n=1 Tax=Salinimicrobium marinum TaxID=680283 RepID=A0A918VYM8_9FLAO|nr:bacillithiol system redox-active protein YtxJ [Salinimicrobium marinum]GHA37292.1 thioredoxin family protein [Salinimicrobium marinum]